VRVLSLSAFDKERSHIARFKGWLLQIRNASQLPGIEKVHQEAIDWMPGRRVGRGERFWDSFGLVPGSEEVEPPVAPRSIVLDTMD